MALLSSLFGRRSRALRAEAARLGMTVQDVKRELPHFSRDGKRMIFAPHPCVRYAMARRERNGVPWALVQRTAALGATLPNGYLLEPEGVVLPSALEAHLRRIAETHAKGLFEFEGTATEVAVFWTETGGVDTVRLLHGQLDWLASY